MGTNQLQIWPSGNDEFLDVFSLFSGGFADSDTGVPHFLHLWLHPDPGG